MDNMWNNYKDPDIAAKQRILVDRQLVEMRRFNPPPVFAAIEPALLQIRLEAKKISVLDAGCASGYYSEVLGYYAADIIQHYAGIDFNRGMIALARSLYPSHIWYVGDLTNLSEFDPRDLVFSSGTIQHIQDWQQAVRELARVTKGWLLLHRTRIWTDDDRKTESFPEPAYGVPLKCWIFNRKEIMGLLESCGMSLELKLPAGEGPTGEAIKREGWHICFYLWRKNE